MRLTPIGGEIWLICAEHQWEHNLGYNPNPSTAFRKSNEHYAKEHLPRWVKSGS